MSKLGTPRERLWTKECRATLSAMIGLGFTHKEIAEHLGRSEQAVRNKACKLGLKSDKDIQFARHSKALTDKFDDSGKVPKDINVWKRRVFQRDCYTCVDCGLHCPSICHAHHIVQRVDAPELVFETSNGVTLCPNCHAIRHLEIGKASSGKRLSGSQKEYVHFQIARGKTKLEIATALGVNVKTVNSIVKGGL